MIAVQLVGCVLVDSFSKVKDDLQGLTSPVVAEGWVLGVEEPTQPELQPLLDAALVEPGTAFSLFLADATDAGAMDESGLDDARVILDAGAVAREAPGQGDGLYALEPGPDSPPYDVGAAWVAAIDLGDDTARSVTFALPPAAALDLGRTHPSGADLVLDLTGQGFHAALVVVLDVGGADPTYSNEPTSPEELYDLLRSDAELTTATVPAAAFPGPGTYAVGVAGMRRGDDGSLEGVNSLLSRGMAGQTRFFPLLVE